MSVWWKVEQDKVRREMERDAGERGVFDEKNGKQLKGELLEHGAEREKMCGQ